MASEYEFLYQGKNKYRVIKRTDGKRTDYFVSKNRKGEWLCSCKAGAFKRRCKHINFIISETTGNFYCIRNEKEIDKYG